jgi:hypothetical protein
MDLLKATTPRPDLADERAAEPSALYQMWRHRRPRAETPSRTSGVQAHVRGVSQPSGTVGEWRGGGDSRR